MESNKTEAKEVPSSWPRRLFSQASFLIAHYAYFTILVLVSSVVFWASSRPFGAVSYVDSLFLAVSAISGTGLNTVDLSSLTTWQQVILFLLIIVGGPVWVSIWVNVLRRRSAGTLNPSASLAPSTQGTQAESHLVLSTGLFRLEGKDAPFPLYNTDAPQRDLVLSEAETAASLEKRAFALTGLFTRLYFLLWQLLGCLALGAWIATRSPEAALSNGMNPWWVGIFNGVSAFNNSGLSLLDANMVPFQKTPFVLITMGLMILAGNTMHPIFMRLILRSAWRMSTAVNARVGVLHLRLDRYIDTLRLILRHPRRFHTHLFSGRETWWLVGTVGFINAVGWTGFELLGLGNPMIEAIPVGHRVLDGLFQSISTRSGGFSVVSMAEVHPSLRLLYVFMMYIPTIPLAASMSHSGANVKGQRQLKALESGPKADADHDHDHDDTVAESRVAESRASFVWRQIHHQFSRDVWILALAVFLIATVENAKYPADPTSYSVFSIVFEVVSAYGCVGVSVGSPGVSYSFAGAWRAGAKSSYAL